jgi:hypothetical protein
MIQDMGALDATVRIDPPAASPHLSIQSKWV